MGPSTQALLVPRNPLLVRVAQFRQVLPCAPPPAAVALDEKPAEWTVPGVLVTRTASAVPGRVPSPSPYTISPRFPNLFSAPMVPKPPSPLGCALPYTKVMSSPG